MADDCSGLTRAALCAALADERTLWDLVVLGGGATGVSVALDAAARGYRVALLERYDFGSGTSSRSTKLIHGGVRYLAQGNVALVKEALRERGRLRANAPHLVHDLEFVVPVHGWGEFAYLGAGLKLYDLLAGSLGFGRTELLGREAALARAPELQPDGLRGAVVYHDGQFDDTRLLLALARTAAAQGAVLLNHCAAVGFERGASGRIEAVLAREAESGAQLRLRTRGVINAAGPYVDALRTLADAQAGRSVAPSQGIHLVVPRRFLPAEHAVLVPKTRDGRVLFAVPWLGHVVLGTTDTPLTELPDEPRPQDAEIDFVLQTAAEVLSGAPRREDVLSAWAGIRPLVKRGGSAHTAALARDHSIWIDRPSGLLTITGGKWTTVRQMAEDCVEQARSAFELPFIRACATRDLRLSGYVPEPVAGPWRAYGADAAAVEALIKERPADGERLHPDLPYVRAEVRWAARQEWARTVEDVLARRTRALFLNARAAQACASAVAELLAEELNKDAQWVATQLQQFETLAAVYAHHNV